jgi:hypothetical protein
MSRLSRLLSAFCWSLLRLSTAGGGRAIGTLSVWLAWERLTTWWWQLQPVRPDGVFRYHLRAYHGPPILLADGTLVRPGDRLVELHFDNRRLLRLATAPDWTPFVATRLMAEDLRILDRLLAEGKLPEVVALHGVTLFARAGRRLGFETRPLPRTPGWGLVRYFMVGLLAVYHPQGWEAAERMRRTAWPGELWMSRARLQARARGPSSGSSPRSSPAE